MRIVIDLPQVNPKLHAHNKGGWRGKSSAVKALRAEARVKTRNVMPVGYTPWPFAVVVYRFYVPDLRRRDLVNMMQSQKAAIDGVVDAGLLVDDDWQHLAIGAVRCVVDRKNPRVVLTFQRMAG